MAACVWYRWPSGSEDLPRATAFYADLLGALPAATLRPVRGWSSSTSTASGSCSSVDAPAALLYLAVDDLDATVDRLRGNGVPVESEPHVIFSHPDDTLGPAGTDEWQAFVRDSEGNLVGLVELRASSD